MSWCRWSSNDFTSDLYVYGAIDGVSVNVASNRIVPVRPMPPPLSEDLVLGTDAWVKAWLDRNREVSDIVDASEHVTIGLPFDGESYYGLSYREAATKLTELKALGYIVPDGVIEDLLSESEEED